jgi:YidC/Oxa1 family membrane protein insertase
MPDRGLTAAASSRHPHFWPAGGLLTMSVFPGVPVDAAYHVVSGLAGLLAPLAGGLATAVAIAGFTVAIRLLLLPLSYRAMRGMAAQARIAPQVQALQKQHAGQPDRLQRELAALYQSEGTSMFAGCLPALAQWPVLSVLYLLFRSPRIAGAPNTLLSHGLFGAPLGSHWLGGAGPLSGQGAVFAGLFLLLAGIGWLSARLARRISAPAAGSAMPAAGPGTLAAKPARTPATGPTAASRGGTAASVSAAVARVVPYFTVAVAAFVPLAAGVYLLTTTAWTLAERAFVQRALAAQPGTDRRHGTG